jgi:imidazolonepropionase-like amidohydrolase
LEEEKRGAVRWEGLPPLRPKKRVENVVFVNVKEIWTRWGGWFVEQTFETEGMATVVVERGKIVCSSSGSTCLTRTSGAYSVVDLKGGSIFPGLISFGSPLGLEKIAGEPSTGEGVPYDPLLGDVPSILGNSAQAIRAADTLPFGTRNVL